MNKGIAISPNADWTIFMNAGDIFYDENTVTSSIAELRRRDVDFIFGGVETSDAANPGRTRIYPPRMHAITEMPGCHQSCFVRTSVLRKLKFDLDYKVAGDFELWLRATHTLGCKTGFLDGAVSRIAPGGYSAQNESLLQEEYYAAIKTYLTPRQAFSWLAWRKSKIMARRLLGLGF